MNNKQYDKDISIRGQDHKLPVIMLVSTENATSLINMLNNNCVNCKNKCKYTQNILPTLSVLNSNIWKY